MKVTMEFDFEEMLYRGLTESTEAKQEFVGFIHYLMLHTTAEMDDETWNQLEDLDDILSETESRWEEHDGCWYVRVRFTDKEFAHDCGNLVESVIRTYDANKLGYLKSNKANSYLEGFGTLVEDIEDEEEVEFEDEE